MYKALIGAALAATVAIAQTAEETAKYPGWAAVMTKEGYTWKPYTVETTDGWTLTLFRLTGHVGKESTAKHPIYNAKKHDTPVLVQHGLY